MTYETDLPLPEQAVAIIGMSGRFPGAADVDELWRLVAAGEEGRSTYTDEELAAAGVPEQLRDDPAYVKSGFPLDGFDRFDADFFGVTRSEAELMDPQHRLLLETAWQALERAGYPAKTFEGRTGVFAGTSGSGYLQERIAPRGAFDGLVSDEIQVAIGNDPGMLALRLSYKLGLTGPSFTVQSACSSSLVSVHLAVQSLLSREADLALAGGVAVREFEPRGYRYEEGAILSTDGHCRPFDADASGTVSGDGVALVVLKRLEDAVADGDHIHAVIRGSAVNNDGSAKIGFTAPSPHGQAEVIAEALAVAGVEPRTVQYVEAHGTATPLGDPIEVQALTEAFQPDAPAGSVHLGSVKSNVGHLDAAAGVTGLIKAALALEHRFIPPTAHFRVPNPALGLDKGPFRVDAEGVPWPATELPPRAGVSAFGIGGTNAHVVLEAAPARSTEAPDGDWQVLPLSARTPEALDTAAARLATALTADDGTRQDPAGFADAAYTLQIGRAALPYRRTVVADSRAAAAAALERPAPAASAVPDEAPGVVFVFPGQGAQYAGMGAELYRTEPVFREALDRCAEILLPHLGWDVREVAFATGGDEAQERLRRTLYTQPTVFSLDYAVAQLLMSWGVRPDAMTGHSLGELVSACLAGVFSLEDALRVVARRAALMQDLPPGRMLSVLLDEAALTEALDGRATIAAVNAPASCVVAGTPEEVAEARRLLEERGVSVRELETSHAFHTALVEPALPGLAEVLRSVRLNTPKIPFLSNVTGTWITDEQATDPDYWVSHTRAPVRFSDGITALAERGDAVVLVEAGPGSQLSGLVRTHPEPSPVVTLLRKPRGEERTAEARTVREGLAELWRHGVAADWAALHDDRARGRVPLPAYPFQGRGHLLPKPEAAAAGNVRTDPERWTYAPVWHPAPLPGAAPEDAPLSWLVLQDDTGLTDAPTAALRSRGHTVTTVRKATAYARTSEHGFDADPADADHLGRVVEELRRTGAAPDRVLHAWAVTGPGDNAGDAAGRYATGLDTGFHSLVALAQALGGSGEDRPVRIDVLTDSLQDAYGTAVIRPERATLYGAVTVLPQEYAWLTCRSVDVTLPATDADRARVAAQLDAELAGEGRESLVAYRGAQRLLRAFAPVGLEPVPTGRAWRAGAGYLVTGASGETGLAFAEQIAASGARAVLIGDPDFPAESEWDAWRGGMAGDDDRVRARVARLAALRAAHPEAVVYRTADLADPGQARTAVEAARTVLGAVDGVLHLADARGSGLTALKTRPDFDAVLAARVRSTLLLDELLADDPLDFFLTASATTGIVGGFGQAENCAAAAFLDTFAQAATAAGRPTLALDWSQWDWDDWFEQQMAGLPEVRELYERLRLAQGIPAADGLALARAALFGALPQVVVSRADFQDVLADQSGLTATSFTDSLGGGRGRGDDDWDPATVWPDDELAQAVARVWHEMLGVSPIGPDDDFYDLGGNSLFAIQIVGRLRQAHGDFPMSAVFEAPTVPGLAAAIRSHQAESIGLDEFEALLREVESLSAGEAEAKLKGDDHV
ncbi:beta-ketoacyl synthase N-terminal-like domain-containing protein [Streptomyces sp. C11-1]|uniref:Beta-ketoacyl synthase N-terminal-like domain-containing protein n=1 Tax=Streptomyces durocortorensis TaxID=2811104 RepID=A0ABY9VZF1_9ACTN|nr:polyketide synthase [Streptomyces durocortorensis]WNF29163.1 beta-ketoacyl synthase N-terminal-like domain-containing protein [Streptomyces durocortorensis]